MLTLLPQTCSVTFPPPLGPGGEFSLFLILKMVMIFLFIPETCNVAMGDKCISVSNPQMKGTLYI